jgi:drug/metabolite transporter (DMT)-like permease
MSWSALGLLLVAAFLHSFWNLLAKRSVDKIAFLMLAAAAGVLLFAPLALSNWRPIAPAGWLIIIASGLAEALYYLLLGAASKTGDLSMVYPLSRGSSPVFVTLIAVLLLGERPSAVGYAGIALVVLGIYVLHLRTFSRADLLSPLRALRDRTSQLAVLTGLTIATYSVLDKQGIRYAEPLTYIWLVLAISALALAPYLLMRKRAEAVRELRVNWLSIALVGAILLGGYVLILIVLQTAPVSYATSVRGISVVFGALLGALVLRESLTAPKLAGACVIFAGVACIGLA